ncbi:MAG: hypothetical protein H6Q06_1766, partial [Acidobacteria bacterium]|nr:hypothetical protein [Acidobacteriota bacterium]
MSPMVARCHAIASHPRFQRAVLVLIVANAVLMGIETSAPLMQRHGPLLLALNAVI